MKSKNLGKGIFAEWQMVARCDRCGIFETEVTSRPEFIKSLRCIGWKIGKDVVCPNCKIKGE